MPSNMNATDRAIWEARYKKALIQAYKDDCHIVSRGHSGNEFFAWVSGSNAASQYMVRGKRGSMFMECGCPARGYCKHRALFREDLLSFVSARKVA